MPRKSKTAKKVPCLYSIDIHFGLYCRQMCNSHELLFERILAFRDNLCGWIKKIYRKCSWHILISDLSEEQTWIMRHCVMKSHFTESPAKATPTSRALASLLLAYLETLVRKRWGCSFWNKWHQKWRWNKRELRKLRFLIFQVHSISVLKDVLQSNEQIAHCLSLLSMQGVKH